MKKILISFLVSILSLSSTFADVTSDVNLIRSDNNSGIFGNIISTIFNTTGKIKAEYLEITSFWLQNGLNLYFNTGNIGIGTTSPSEKLHVVGNIISNDPIAANHVATKSYVDSQGDLWTLSGSDVFYNSGKVGIGLNSPVADLDINGDLRTNNILTSCIGSCGTSITPPGLGGYSVNGDLSITGNTTATNITAVGINTTGNITTIEPTGTNHAATKNYVDQNKFNGRVPIIDNSFDCTYNNEFPNGDTSFKFNLGNGIYKCMYMFYVGNATNEKDSIYICPSKGLRDAGGNKIPLTWKQDDATWRTMWDKARTFSSQGEFKLYGNAGDRNANHYIGVNLIWHHTQPYRVHTQHGNYNSSSWQSPSSGGTQRSDYSSHGFVLCEI